jgi:hypothetical protein
VSSSRRLLVVLCLSAVFANCGDDDPPTAPEETPELEEVVGRWVGENLTVVVTKDGRWTSDGYLIGEGECWSSTGDLRLRMQLEGVVALGPPAGISATATTGTITELTKSIEATWDADWKVLRGTATGRARTPRCTGSMTRELTLIRADP